MLQVLGCKNIAELIKKAAPNLPPAAFSLPVAMTEIELSAHIQTLAAKNKKVLNFAGAGAYEHFIPAAVNAISSRGEFLAAYTPYQAEASQGTLQAVYEYQSCITALFDMDVSNASHYDGATALAEAVNAAVKIKNKNAVLIPAALHPHYKEVLHTYYKYAGIKFEEISCASGGMDIADLKNKLKDAAAVVLANPNFYGVIEDVDAISAAAKEAGALLIASVNPLSLGVLRTPGSYGADFAVGEGQPLGSALNYGGPYLGVFTCKKEFVRSLPGRVVGMTKDAGGKRAFTLTLQAREQHIRRERAASNICSNEALCALNAAIYLTLLGPKGLEEVCALNLENANYLKEKILKLKGFSVKYKKEFFNEFVIACPKPPSEIIKKLAAKNIAAGVDLGGKDLLVCATETKTKAEIDAFVSALGAI